LRGELRHENGRLLYLDCYNANPASMHDALKAFADTTPADEPRLYVLGGMEELGSASPVYHRELGRALALRDEDQVIVIGDEAKAVREGALEAGARSGQIEIADKIDAIRPRVAAFRGAVFVKGSRRYQLETILGGETALAGAH